jgi:hypothetical protein
MLSHRRLHATAELMLGAAVLLAGLCALPLGLETLAAAPLVAAGYTLGPEAAEHPLAALAIRAFACLPVGDLATRANLASAVLVAAAAVGLGRLVHEVLAERPAVRDALAHPIAVGGGVLVVMLGCTFFRSTTSATPAAVTLLLLIAFWLRALRLLRAPDRPRDALALALLAGLGLGAAPVVPLLCWPIALLLWVRALRRRERWALIAPVLSLAGAAVQAAAFAPFGLLRSTVPSWRATGDLERALLAAAAESAGALGAVGVLVAGVGAAVLAARARRSAGLLAFAAATALLISASSWWGAGPAATARVVALAALAVPLSAGIDHLATRLGLARAATALVVAAIAVVWPALDGGAGRWTRPARLPERLLAEAHGRIPPARQADPGGAPMRGLFDYGQALGLRPDLALRPR